MNKLIELWIDGYSSQTASYLTGLDPLITKIFWSLLDK